MVDGFVISLGMALLIDKKIKLRELLKSKGKSS